MEFIVLSSGSKGNCSAIKINEQIILVDCGVRFSHLEKTFKHHNLDITKISHVIITHEHADHILGLKTLNSKIKHAKILLTKGTYIAYTSKTGHIVNNYEFICPHNKITLAGTEFCFFPTMHDARESVGFSLEIENKKFSYLTDCGNFNQHILDSLANTTHFALEANYCPDMLASGPYPEFLKQRVAGDYGHLSNYQSQEILNNLNNHLEYVCLMHLSEKNNNPTLAESICKKALKNDTVLVVASQNNGANLVKI